jgi:hypothetical protein
MGDGMSTLIVGVNVLSLIFISFIFFVFLLKRILLFLFHVFLLGGLFAHGFARFHHFID